MILLILNLLQAASLRIAVVSDIHLSNSCAKPSTFNCDTDSSLLISAFSEMSRHSPDLLISLGDEISHNQRDSLHIKSLTSDLFEIYSTYFPYTPVIHTIGNNDGVFADQPHREYLDQLAFLYQYWFPTHWKQYSFLQNGYYTFNFEPFKFLVLNTVLFLTESESGNSQLDWVQEEINNTNLTVVLICHAPPAISMFNGGEPVWNPRLLEKFKGILKSFKQKVSLVLAGHLHRGSFSTIDSIPVIINPSLSPIYFTNPSYRVFDLTSTSIDFSEHSLINGTWQANYKFSEEFTGLNLLQEYVQGIKDQSEVLDKITKLSRGNFKDFNQDLRSLYEISTNVQLDLEEMRKIVWCSLNDYSFDEFLECSNNG